jgi:hypothetical protein
MSRALAQVATVCLLASCAGGEQSVGSGSSPSGPPGVRGDVVAEHAEQFSEELPERRAGTQEELAAATYITGHLQQAGYVVLLDAVPLKNLVRSTNVVARPPTGEDPHVVVVVPYDVGPGSPDGGEAIGLFLEVARSLRVRVPDHSVQFVAVGAEFTDVGGGRLGSRRLAQELIQAKAEPTVVVLKDVGRDSDFVVGGPAGEEILESAGGMDKADVTHKLDDSLWRDSPFEFAVVSGSSRVLGRVLLDYLASSAR